MPTTLAKVESSALASYASFDQALSNIKQPFEQRIMLIKTYITGLRYQPAALKHLKSYHSNDRIILQRDINNTFDEFAIKVLLDKGSKAQNTQACLGYVPSEANEILAKLLDAGKKLEVELVKPKNKTDKELLDEYGSGYGLEVYLVD